jgi:F-type H+-transporting ATPase subunit epsilon
MADEYMQLDVVTPEKAVISRKAIQVIAPGSAGEFGVLMGHTPFLTTLRPGQIVVETEDRDIFIAVGGGFAEVIGNRVIILAETADLAEDIDTQEVKNDLDHAEERMKQLSKDDPEYTKWENRVKRAEIKLYVVENWEKNK